MKFLSILIVVLFTSFTASFAKEEDNKAVSNNEKIEKVMLTGNVSDELTGELLVGVEVVLEGTDKKAYTDFDGNFVFDNVTPGEYTLVANYISYEKDKIENKIIDIFSNEINVKLKHLE